MYEATISHISSATYAKIKDDPFKVYFQYFPSRGSKWFAYKDGSPGDRYLYETIVSSLVDDEKVVIVTSKGNVYEMTNIQAIQP